METGSFNCGYKVCGEQEVIPGSSDRGSDDSAKVAWSTPRPWAGQQRAPGRQLLPLSTMPSSSFSSTCIPGSSKKSAAGSNAFESHFKRCIPFVSLALDNSAMVIESTDDNIYVKVPESIVSVRTILAAIGEKITIASDDLVLLDSKFFPISDDKG